MIAVKEKIIGAVTVMSDSDAERLIPTRNVMYLQKKARLIGMNEKKMLI